MPFYVSSECQRVHRLHFKPPCRPPFITRISRSSSGFVTAGPNHHQRIMILASLGGRFNERCSSLIF